MTRRRSRSAILACGVLLALSLGAGRAFAQQATTPAQVASLSDVKTIAAGRFFSLALKNDGTVWAWGNNEWGQLGDGTTINRDVPVQVAGLSGVVAIAAGSYYSMALLVEYSGSYRVYAWGRNDSGQLGLDDPSIVRQTTPARASLPDVQSMAGGAEHTVALRYTSEVFTWGINEHGQLGNPSEPATYVEYAFGFVLDTSTGYPYPPFAGVSAIAAGHDHSLALKSGAVWAWGYNSYRQLGDGTTADRNAPVQVKGPNGVGFLTGVAAIAGGQDHSLALKTDGTLWAWGENTDGELGDGTLTSRATPVQVIALSNVESAVGGGHHTVAVKADGTVWAWGENWFGQLGDGTLTSHSTPAQVVGLSGARAVAAGCQHSLALKDDGTVWAWGDDTFGQLGGVQGEPSPGARFPLCHKPGTPAEKTLRLPRPAFAEHLGHGDQLGRCR